MKKTIFELFPGIQVLDAEPVLVENRFGYGSIVLSPEEVAVYDYTMGCELIGDVRGLRKGIEWFQRNNIEAYMTLLD